MTAAMGGPVVIDLSALGTSGRIGRRIARHSRDFAAAMERHRPDLVGRYLLAPEQRVDEDLAELLAGKLAVAGSTGAVPESARVFHSMSVLDLARPMGAIWPAEVERLGLWFSASVPDLHLRHGGSRQVDGERRRRRQRARCEVFRQADALLATSPAIERELVEEVGAEAARVAVVGSGEPWQDVVARSAAVFEGLASRERRPWRRELRLAFVSPFPPIPSGVARYSSRLVEALSDELGTVAAGAELDCFADGLDRRDGEPVVPAAGGELFDARQFLTVERAIGGYDRVVYVLGNSEFHTGALVALRQRSGTVIAHDVRMSGLLRHSCGRRGAVPGGLEGAVRRAYSHVSPGRLGSDAGREDGHVDEAGLLLIGDVLPHAERLLVSSESARRLAIADVTPELRARIGVLPYAMELEPSELEAVATARAANRTAPPLVASFGIVDPSKLPRLVLEAVAALGAGRDLELAFVGPVSKALEDELAALAADLGIARQVQVTGHVERSAYLAYLGRATLAVQPRAGFSGEASGAVGDCLAAGVATIVSDIGWMSELPDDAVVKLDTSAGAVDELAEVLRSLLDDADRRAAMAARASAYASEQTFVRAAAALIAALDLPGEPAER
ncbi:MAG TPA: glycosyltransferase [Acidimicrobiales bacterium]|nr:glycosyltransferase [Acidimicrobiales bacterium]